MGWRGLACLLAAVWISGAAKAAEFDVYPTRCEIKECFTGESINVEMKGKIVKGDYARFADIVKNDFRPIRYLHLASPGGDVAEAMKIGRLVRQMLISTDAPSLTPSREYICSWEVIERPSPECVCLSSCFLIYAAGINRSGNALGLHRPRFEEAGSFANLPADQANRKYNEVVSSLESYLLEMGVNRKYLEQMMRVSSAEMRMLDTEEVEADLKGYIPAYAEWLKARCGEISSSEDKAMSDMQIYMIYKQNPHLIDHSLEAAYIRSLMRSVERKLSPELIARYEAYAAKGQSIRMCRWNTIFAEQRVRSDNFKPE